MRVETLRGHAITAWRCAVRKMRKVEFYRQGSPTGINADRRPRHPIGCEEHQRGDQSVLFTPALRALLTASNDF